MKHGMLWQVEDRNPLEEEINQAVEYYRKKYGRSADTVEMNPAMIENVENPKLVIVTVRAAGNLPMGVMWIGAEVE